MGQEEQKFQKRATAYKLSIDDILSGEYIKNTERPYLKKYNLKVRRVRVMGTVINKYDFEKIKKSDDLEDDYTTIQGTTLVLDDGTGIIRVIGWNDDKKFTDEPVIGDIVDVVGRLREYNEEILIVPDYIKIIDDPNWELLRELELLNLKRIYQKETFDEDIKISELQNYKISDSKILEKDIEISEESITQNITSEIVSNEDSIILSNENIDLNLSIEDRILQLLSSKKYKNGLTKEEFYKLIDASEDDINDGLNELFCKGKIYENPDGTTIKM